MPPASSETHSLLSRGRAPEPRRVNFLGISNLVLFALAAALIVVAALLGGINRGWLFTSSPEPTEEYPEPLVVAPPNGAPTEAVIIFLHGLGGSSDGVSVAAKLIPLEGVRWIFPNAPSIPVAVTYNQPTPAWYNIEHFAETLDDLWDDSEGIMRSTSYIASMIKDLLAEGIPSEKIIVGGFSQGGAIALTTALHGAGVRLGGCFVLSSYLPMHNQYPVPLLAIEAKRTPVFIAHGTMDTVLPYSFGDITRQKLESFMDRGTVQFVGIPNMAHERLGAVETRLLSRWLMRVLERGGVSFGSGDARARR